MLIDEGRSTQTPKATTPWKVTPKSNGEPLFGPMSPPPSGAFVPQQSPSSARSDLSSASSIMGKSGEWTVIDKMFTPPVPRLPERQHAGWQVSENCETKSEDVKGEKREKREKGEKGEKAKEACSEDEDQERRKKKKKHKKEKRKKKDKKEKGKEKNKKLSDSESKSGKEETKKEKKKKKKKHRYKKHRKSDSSSSDGEKDDVRSLLKKKRKRKPTVEDDTAEAKKQRLVDYSEGSSSASSEGPLNPDVSRTDSKKTSSRPGTLDHDRKPFHS